MKLKSVYIRFYKSFNFHQLRALQRTDKNKNINPMPWEFIGENKFYPYVKVEIDKQITAVVGANESGKSHLLSAIEKGIYGNDGEFKIERKDFCRYSHFFQSVDENIPRFPDFGFEWTDISEEENEYLLRLSLTTEGKIKAAKSKSDRDKKFTHFYFFRNNNICTIYLPDKEGKITPFPVKDLPENFLPRVFRIDSEIALPDRVPIGELLKGRKKETDKYEIFDRLGSFLIAQNNRRVKKILNDISQGTVEDNYVKLEKTIQNAADDLLNLFKKKKLDIDDDERREHIKAFNLVHDLIFEIAKITKEDLEILYQAFHDGETGLVKSMSNKVNSALEKSLRFPSIWSQDKNFALRVEPTEHELNFVINDRTECQYSFDERSSGLKHFLSYYIQYLTHKPTPNAKSEILLMDEPDAFLSGEAQQDLLKIFQMFADPQNKGKSKDAVPVQVIYVTHSPFLIDKNHSERVRALEKPEGTVGTQVVLGIAQNRYEPLRSAFGPFLGETAFMSQCNLMVEGPADQILLAGMTTHLRNTISSDKASIVPESELLDLNKITIVPCDGGTQIPYMVYLATGRGIEKPAVIVMVDGDDEGNTAKELLIEGSHPSINPILKEEFILQLNEITLGDVGLETDETKKTENPFIVLEDLVPLSLSIRTVKNFLKILFDLPDEKMNSITEENVKDSLKPEKSKFWALQELVKKIEPKNTYNIGKPAFAKTLIESLPKLEASENKQVMEELKLLKANLRAVFRKLRSMQDLAESNAVAKKSRKKVEEKVDLFFGEYQELGAVKRDEVSRVLNTILAELEGNVDKERSFIIEKISEIRRNHQLMDLPNEYVADFEALINDFKVLKDAKKLAYAPQNTFHA